MPKLIHMIAALNTDDGKAPEWMLLFKAGLGTLADGVQYLVDQTSLALVKAMIASRGNEIHFDYEHASVQEKALLANGAPAAGWIKDLIWEDGEGIKAKVDWTEKAALHIASKEYRYFSPVFAARPTDKRVCYLDSVALTNRPRTNNLTPILAALEVGLGQFEEETMDREKLIAALGLKADATDEMIIAALAGIGMKFPDTQVNTQVNAQAKVQTKEVIPKTVMAALDLKETDGESVVVASIHALKQTTKTGVSLEDFNALKQTIADRDATDLVTAALSVGKVTPDQKDWAQDYATKDPEGFKVYVAKAPVVVPVDKLPGKTEKAKAGELTASDLQVASMMGVETDDVKKYGLEVNHG